MNSNDLKHFLTQNQDVQQLVAGRCGALDVDDEFDDEELDYIHKIVAYGKDPKRWKRIRKFKVGGPSDSVFGDAFPEWVDCIAREFYLEETDHVTVMLITRGDEIVGVEDFSD